MDYKNMPPDSRVWVYQADRELTTNEVDFIQKKAESFLNSWTAHGALLDAAIEIFYNRFIVLFVNEKQAIASGCGIDKSVHFIKELETHFKLSLLDRLNVAYKTDEKVFVTKLSSFEELLKAGKLTKDSIVFNNMVTTKTEFDNDWETTVSRSWHRKMLVDF